jgi:acetoin utilization protein AcuB
MRLQDIMTRNVKTVPPVATVAQARTLMRTAGVHHLIVSEGRRVVGVLSDRDLGGRVGARRADAQGMPVSDVMSREVVSADPEWTVRQAANRLRGRGIGCLAVLEEDKLVGIVTTTDLLDLIGRGADRPIEHSQAWTLSARGRRGGRPQDRHARRA